MLKMSASGWGKQTGRLTLPRTRRHQHAEIGKGLHIAWRYLGVS